MNIEIDPTLDLCTVVGPTKLIRAAADIQIDPDRQRAVESAYRRGLHQAVGFAFDLVADAPTLAAARSILGRAESIAAEYRSTSRHPGRPPILDEIRQRLSKRRS